MTPTNLLPRDEYRSYWLEFYPIDCYEDRICTSSFDRDVKDYWIDWLRATNNTILLSNLIHLNTFSSHSRNEIHQLFNIFDVLTAYNVANSRDRTWPRGYENSWDLKFKIKFSTPCFFVKGMGNIQGGGRKIVNDKQ